MKICVNCDPLQSNAAKIAQKAIFYGKSYKARTFLHRIHKLKGKIMSFS